MANLRAIDIDALPETFSVALSDVFVAETDIGTRGVIMQVLCDAIVVAYYATPGPTTPPPTTPPPTVITTPAPTTTAAPTTPPPTTQPGATTPPGNTLSLTVFGTGFGNGGSLIVNGVGVGTSYSAFHLTSTTVTIQAVASSGFLFNVWSGNTGNLNFGSSTASNSVTMPGGGGTISLTAVFNLITTPAPTTAAPTTPPPTTAGPTTPGPTTPAPTTPAPTTPPPTTFTPPAFNIETWSGVGIAVVGDSPFIMGAVVASIFNPTVSCSATFTNPWTSGGTVTWTQNGSPVITDSVSPGATNYSNSFIFASSTNIGISFAPDGNPGDLYIVGASCTGDTDSLINASMRAWTTNSNGAQAVFNTPQTSSISHYRVYDVSFGEEIFSSGNTSNYNSSFQGPWGTLSNIGGTTQSNNGSVTVFAQFTGSTPGPARYTLIDVQ